LGDRAVVARAGLIGGRGDRSDRFGYYPAAFARAGSEAVLLPAVGETTVQTVSAADLAAWLVAAGEGDASGVYDTYGEPIAFADLVALARAAAGHQGPVHEADPDWLVARGVGYFMGPRSLPFWLPAGHELTVTRPSARARAAGLSWRPYRRLVDEALTDERTLGCDRERRAGLTRAEELELLAALAGDPPPVGPSPRGSCLAGLPAVLGVPSMGRVSRVGKGVVRLVPDGDGDAPDDGTTVATARDGTLPMTVGDPVVPAVGDRVVLDGDRALVMPRTSELVRDTVGKTSLVQVIAANVDVVVVVEHLEPEPALGRLERMVTIAWRADATPLIVLTKSDLVDDTDHWVAQARAVAPGV